MWSNALLISSGTAFWWFVLVEACCDGVVYVVLEEWLLLKPWCVEMCGMLFVMYGSSNFTSVFLSLRELEWVCMMCLCSCLCLVLELV